MPISVQQNGPKFGNISHAIIGDEDILTAMEHRNPILPSPDIHRGLAEILDSGDEVDAHDVACEIPLPRRSPSEVEYVRGDSIEGDYHGLIERVFLNSGVESQQHEVQDPKETGLGVNEKLLTQVELEVVPQPRFEN